MASLMAYNALKRCYYSSLKLGAPLLEMVKLEWYLGFTSFGGPPVHFQIFRKKFVDDLQWIDDQMYEQLFALGQSLPGPGSTKMLYAINVLRSGFIIGIISFLMWRCVFWPLQTSTEEAKIKWLTEHESLPGAIAAYGLAIGVSNIGSTLPTPVYALLSGLNSATVGIIFLAAVQLSAKSITDPLSRLLVFFGGAAGMLYNALWYFPLLLVVGGVATVTWDMRWLHKAIKQVKKQFERTSPQQSIRETQDPQDSIETQNISASASVRSRNATGETTARRAEDTPSQTTNGDGHDSYDSTERPEEEESERIVPRSLQPLIFSWKLGISVIVFFFATFTAVMVLRGTLEYPPRTFSLFANLFLAGTIIFGGGPVVIPLLRDYVVEEGWVSPRDFILGLAIIQAFPGPNFNFAVYLGALAVAGTGTNAIAGALVCFIGIFAPGLILQTGFMGLWSVLRQYRFVISVLRGINATAVGLIYAAVYRIWEIGRLSPDAKQGSSLGQDPWWLTVAATAFVGGMWFKLEPAVAIILGGAMGMIWYGVATT